MATRKATNRFKAEPGARRLCRNIVDRRLNRIVARNVDLSDVEAIVDDMNTANNEMREIVAPDGSTIAPLAPPAPKLILAYVCEKIRAGDFSSVEYGDKPARQILSRSVLCRCCGGKIAKGAEAIRFAWDFDGSGSWTATTANIHVEACERPAGGG